MLSHVISCYLDSSVLSHFRHYSQWFYSSLFTPLLFNQSVSWPSQVFPLHFLLLWRHRDKHHHCYTSGLCGSQWFLCIFVTLTVIPIQCLFQPISSSSFLYISLSLFHPLIFPLHVSLFFSLSLDLFGASMRQGSEKLALVQLVRSECRASMLELFANVHSTAHTPAWVTWFNYMGNFREKTFIINTLRKDKIIITWKNSQFPWSIFSLFLTQHWSNEMRMGIMGT